MVNTVFSWKYQECGTFKNPRIEIDLAESRKINLTLFMKDAIPN